MKKILLIISLLMTVFLAKAQSTNAEFKLDFSAGYAKPTRGFGVQPGPMLTIEPQFYVSKNFVVGFRFEGALLGYNRDFNDEVFSFFGSTCITGEVYLSRKGIKPFIGFGGGLYTRHYIFQDLEDNQLYTSGFGDIKVGAFGRAGFEIGPIRLTAGYNVIGNDFNYAAFTVGYVIDKL